MIEVFIHELAFNDLGAGVLAAEDVIKVKYLNS